MEKFPEYINSVVLNLLFCDKHKMNKIKSIFIEDTTNTTIKFSEDSKLLFMFDDDKGTI